MKKNKYDHRPMIASSSIEITQRNDDVDEEREREKCPVLKLNDQFG